MRVKNEYSFDKWGEQRETAQRRNLFKTTYRGTKQPDSVYYRDKLAPVDIKHALVDPTHSFSPSVQHRNHLSYDFKGDKAMNTAQIQRLRLETVNAVGKPIHRLPDVEKLIDPVNSFRTVFDERADVMDKFRKSNYMLNQRAVVGVAKAMNPVLRDSVETVLS